MVPNAARSAKLPDHVLNRLANGDAALWISASAVTHENIEQIVDLISLPWQVVLCESTSAALASALDDTSNLPSAIAQRTGYIHVVAADPDTITLPPRCLPVYFLNGRSDASAPEEGPSLGAFAAQRRRLNMLGALQTMGLRELILVTEPDEQPVIDGAGLSAEGFRPNVTLVSEKEPTSTVLDAWVDIRSSTQRFTFTIGPLSDALGDFVARARLRFTDEEIVVSIKAPDKTVRHVNITSCELVEHPLLNRYSLIQTKHIRYIAPHDVTLEVFNNLFDKTSESWDHYAAGVPWERNPEAKQVLLKALSRIEREGADASKIFVIASEPGAGGTTLAHSLAYTAAQTGFPALVARQLAFTPDPKQIESFLLRVRQLLTRNLDPDQPDDQPISETPWLLVFDIQHWVGRPSEIELFRRVFVRAGRPVAILAVVGPDIGDALAGHVHILAELTHELSDTQVLALGRHLNRFLEYHDRSKSDTEWKSFWLTHRPSMDISVSSFWIALEFWLRGFLDVNTLPLQDWIYEQFRASQPSPHLSTTLLQIAALTSERQPFPETLLPEAPTKDGLPTQYLLEEIRHAAPALGLVTDRSGPTKLWAFAHDLIGTYLIEKAFSDRAFLADITSVATNDVFEFKLLLLQSVATKRALARKEHAGLAMAFAVNIFKLGEDGNLSFNRLWRKVLYALEAMPREVWMTSRTFRHHVAISKRRVATSEPTFYDVTADEKEKLLTSAIRDIEFALRNIPKSDSDTEPDANLHNSLSLAYQNFSDLLLSRGDSSADRLLELRKKATEAARKAQHDNPSNSYVLETLTRNLLQNARLYPAKALESAIEALSYIHEAMSLDTSYYRESRLVGLANEAMVFIRQADSQTEIDRLCDAGQPLGYLARAWLLLSVIRGDGEYVPIEKLPRDAVEAAIAALEPSPPNLAVQLLRYRLISAGRPHEFEAQLGLLDDLSGRMPLSHQLELERAILMHQRNRHAEALNSFFRLRAAFRNQDVYVTVPKRLEWLLTEAGQKRMCNARVAEQLDFRRARARVREINNSAIPFFPEDFGSSSLAVGMQFRCTIRFGINGPFIKPPEGSESR